MLATFTHDEDASVTLDDPVGGAFAIRAVAPPDAEIGSVQLELTGAKTAARTLNTEPWSLFGNDGDALLGESLPAGDYTLTATVYPEADLGGDVEQTLTVSFTVAAPNNPATGQPTISGTTQVGETLTADVSGIADEDGLDNALFAYQWVRNNGNDDADIQDATGSTHTLSDDDEDTTIKVQVTFTDDAGNSESITSAATAAVAASSNDIEETPSAPQNLVATENDDGSVTLTWNQLDDDSITGHQILRRRPSEGENALSVYVADTGSTATTYTDTDVTAGVKYVYRVKAINAAGVGKRSKKVEVTP